MPDQSIQRNKHCSTCPWVRSGGDRSKCFSSEALIKTVVRDHEEERLHYCHSSRKHLCSGYLAFLAKSEGGLVGSNMARVALGLGILAADKIDQEAIDTFDSIEEMLDDHDDRLMGFDNISVDFGIVSSRL